MKPMISDFVTGTEVTSFFLTVSKPEVRKAKNGSAYLVLKLQDRSGEIDARVWGLASDASSPVKEGSIVKVRAEVTEWNDQQQLKVSNIREVNDSDDVDQVDLFQCAERPPEAMWRDLTDLLLENLAVGSPISQLIQLIMEENSEALMAAPAAKGMHHSYLGGLLEHCLSMCQVAVKVANHYGVDRELLLAGCLLHDVGKIFELSFPIISYTLKGTLLGHIPMGMQLVSESIDRLPSFPPKLKIAVLHLVASHHGTLSWGSPKTPLMREAILLHLIDMMDSRVAICNRAIAGGLSEDGLTDWVKAIEGPVFQYKRE
jgi:3'-5' exoribonuclease